jgi:hypothetical protein
MLWAQQILNCLAKLKEMIAIILKFVLHFKMGGGGDPLSLLSPGAKIPNYATYLPHGGEFFLKS